MPSQPPVPRARQRVLGVGGFVAFLAYVIGAPIYNNRIENDLERRVPDALAAAGLGNVTAKFSGQEGRLRCTDPLADPEGALVAAHAVRGVNTVELERGCRVTAGTGDDIEPTLPDGTADSGSQPATSTGASLPDFATVGDVIAGDPQFASLARLANESDLAELLGDPDASPVTVFAPTDDAFDTLPAAVAGALDDDADLRTAVARGHVVTEQLDLATLRSRDGTSLTTLDGDQLTVALDGDTVTVGGAPVSGDPIVTPNGIVYTLDAVLLPDDLAGVVAGGTTAAQLDQGTLTLTGGVADQAAADTLVFAATAAVGPDRLDNQLAVDAEQGLDATGAADLATLIAALDSELVAGEAGFDGTGLYLTGAYANDADRARAEAAAEAVGAATDLAVRPDATPAEATALEGELNEYVRANPITFGQGSAVLDDSAVTVIDLLAARLVEFGGLATVVEGHTDSDGNPATNQTLSEQRAGAVRQALIERGVEADSITAEGFGSTEPVLGSSGIEDKTASRRVEFRIATG